MDFNQFRLDHWQQPRTSWRSSPNYAGLVASRMLGTDIKKEMKHLFQCCSQRRELLTHSSKHTVILWTRFPSTEAQPPYLLPCCPKCCSGGTLRNVVRFAMERENWQKVSMEGGNRHTEILEEIQPNIQKSHSQ